MAVSNEDNLKALTVFLDENPSVQFIRLQWLDYSSTLRTRVLTKRHTRLLAEQGHYHGLASSYLTMIDSAVPLSKQDLRTAVGQSILIPDFKSLRICAWMNGHASVSCFFGQESSQKPGRGGVQDPVKSALCPRFALEMALKRARQLDLEVHVGIELEFCVFLLDTKGGAAPLLGDPHQASSIRTLEKRMLPVLDEIVGVLETADIYVQHYHAEGQQDQFELTLEPLPAMEAADTYILAREAIRNVCAKHSLVATFHPWTPMTSGIHVNLSLQGAIGRKVEESFLAGILDHLCALLAIGLPLPVSYKRVGVNWYHQAVGKFVSWGTQNRQTPIRKKGSAFWELRFADGFTQIYIFLAAVIVVGLTGVEAKTILLLKDCNGTRCISRSCCILTLPQQILICCHLAND